MDITEIFAQTTIARLSESQSSALIAALSDKIPSLAKAGALAIENASLLIRLVAKIELQLKVDTTDQALAYKFVDCWALVQGLQESSYRLFGEKSQLALFILLEQVRRAGIQILELMTLVGKKEDAHLICNLLIELNKSVIGQGQIVQQLEQKFG